MCLASLCLKIASGALNSLIITLSIAAQDPQWGTMPIAACAQRFGLHALQLWGFSHCTHSPLPCTRPSAHLPQSDPTCSWATPLFLLKRSEVLILRIRKPPPSKPQLRRILSAPTVGRFFISARHSCAHRRFPSLLCSPFPL